MRRRFACWVAMRLHRWCLRWLIRRDHLTLASGRSMIGENLAWNADTPWTRSTERVWRLARSLEAWNRKECLGCQVDIGDST